MRLFVLFEQFSNTVSRNKNVTNVVVSWNWISAKSFQAKSSWNSINFNRFHIMREWNRKRLLSFTITSIDAVSGIIVVPFFLEWHLGGSAMSLSFLLRSRGAIAASRWARLHSKTLLYPEKIQLKERVNAITNIFATSQCFRRKPNFEKFVKMKGGLYYVACM